MVIDQQNNEAVVLRDLEGTFVAAFRTKHLAECWRDDHHPDARMSRERTGDWNYSQCDDCLDYPHEMAAVRAEARAKDELIIRLSDRLSLASEVLSRAAERRPEMFADATDLASFVSAVRRWPGEFPPAVGQSGAGASRNVPAGPPVSSPGTISTPQAG